MTHPEPVSTPETPEPRRGMPREAIRAIAYSGFFCGLMTLFIAYYAFRQGYAMFFIVLNVLVAIFLAAGAAWMLKQLKRL